MDMDVATVDRLMMAHCIGLSKASGKAGEYPYYCILHASGPDDEYGMTGKVIVQ